MSTTKQTQERTTLPKDGMSRFKQFQTFLPISRETWRKLVRDKRACKSHSKIEPDDGVK